MDPREQVSSAQVLGAIKQAWTRVRVCAAGKTELLYHLLCRCVMPAAAGGLEVEVMFVDTDYSLDMLRLVSILDRRLRAGRRAHTLSQAEARLPMGSGFSGLEHTVRSQYRLALAVLIIWDVRGPPGLELCFTSELLSVSSQLAPLAPPLPKQRYARAFLASWWSTAPPPPSSC